VLLEVERSGIDLVVTLDDVVSAFEITIEQHCGCSGDQLGDRSGKAYQLGTSIVEVVVEALA